MGYGNKKQIIVFSILGILSIAGFSPIVLDLSVHGASDKISSKDYDMLKNCTSDTSKVPDSIEYLTYFNCGHVSKDGDGRTLREFTLIIQEGKKINIAENITFDAWTFNGTVPGPTMRMTEGDHVKINVINSNDSKHSHSLHMHSIHSSEMDGVDHPIKPGDNFTYDFIAQPYGVYPYHCHIEPIEQHISKGLYGMMIIDPKEPRPKMTEFAMLMNGYDLNVDKMQPFHIPSGNTESDSQDTKPDNQVYTVNGKAFDYVNHPIGLETGKPYRIYLVNMLEFDLVNSFHLHGNMFNYYPSGTSTKPEFMNDIVTLSQGDRGIIEFTPQYPGKYMFHAHQTEFTAKGWMGFFDVQGQPNQDMAGMQH